MTKLPQSCGTFARHASQKVVPGEPGVLRSRTKVALTSNRKVVPQAEIRPNVGRSLATSAHQDWAKFGPNWRSLVELGQIRPTLGAILAVVFSELGKHLANIGQIWGSVTPCWLNSNKLGPNLGYRGNCLTTWSRNFWATPEHAGFAGGKFLGRVARATFPQLWGN